MTFTVRSRLVWYGERTLARIAKGAEIGVTKAANVYFKELKHRLIKAGEGSIPFFSHKDHESFSGGFGTRLRIKHSTPGSVPLFQTGNLINSIKKSFSFNRTIGKNIVPIWRARISSDVGYAATLERGGSFSARKKKHTSVVLINPLKKAVTIMKRPVWGPVFWAKRVEMLNIINKAIVKELIGI